MTDFGVLDENFLKMKPRALELLEGMERRDKRYTFGIFSSAETLRALGDLDLLVPARRAVRLDRGRVEA